MGNAHAKAGLPTTVQELRHSTQHRLDHTDVVPINEVAAMGSFFQRKIINSTPAVSAEGLAMLPPEWAEIVNLSATTKRPSMLMALVNQVRTTEAAVKAARATARVADMESGRKDEFKEAPRTAGPVQFLENYATAAEMKEMGAASLSGKWLDVDTRRRWGLDLLTPGCHILYSGAFGMQFATHHGIYLGFIHKDTDLMSPTMLHFLRQTIHSLRSGDVSLCVKQSMEAFKRNNPRIVSGGGKLKQGVDLVLEVGANNVLQTRARLLSLKSFAATASLVSGRGFIMRDSRADVASVHRTTGIPLWLHRALCSIGKVDYKIKTLNCEHCATFVSTGVHNSTQYKIFKKTDKAQPMEMVPGLGLLLTIWNTKGDLAERIKTAIPKRAVDYPVQAILDHARTDHASILRDPRPLTEGEDMV